MEDLLCRCTLQSEVIPSGLLDSAPAATTIEITALRPPHMNLTTGPLEEHPLIAQALIILEEELPPNLCYHDKDHTVSVITKVVQLANLSRLSERDTELLAIAAAWHDTGYRERPFQNEPLAAAWVAGVMSERGHYSDEEIREVQQAILDTQMKPRAGDGVLQQIAHGRLSPWLLDADLANFGSKNFFPVSFRLLREVEGYSIEGTKDLFSPNVLAFFRRSSQILAAHCWNTEPAYDLFQAQKEVNQNLLKILVSALSEGNTPTILSLWNRMLPLRDEPYQLIED